MADDRRLPGLDGVRGIAIVLVVMGHFATTTFPGTPSAGVAVFFALSGYLITGLLRTEVARTGRVELLAFYRRRAARLLPALVLMLLCVAAMERWQRIPQDWIVHDFLVSLFYVGNWWPATHHGWPSPLGHMWSLAVEEQFYLVWPAVILLVHRLRRPALLLAVLALASAAWRVVMWQQGADFNRWYCGTDTVAGALLAGCALAFVPRDRRFPTWSAGPALALLVLAGTEGPWWPGTEAGRCLMFLYGAAAGVVLLLAATRGRTWWLELAVLVRLGRISYSLYLWHLPVLWYFRMNVTPFEGRYENWVALVLSLAIAEASFRWVEVPFLRRFGRRRGEPTAVPASRVPEPR